MAGYVGSSSALEDLFGAKLQGKEGPVSTSEALAGKNAIGIYFSAHWCPPCRGFTPKLAEWYTKDLKAKGLEVIFVSSDRDEAAFNDYFGEQPWLALPFEDRDRKDSLSKKFKVQGIPSFVILDAEGKKITTDGRGAVEKDPTGVDLPWRPKSLKEVLSGAKLVKGDGSSVNLSDAVAGKKAFGIWYSWFSCQCFERFVPVVCVSSDRDADSFKSYFAEQPWLALDFDNRKAKEELSTACKVEGIPSFVILDPSDFSMINEDGRAASSGDPEGKELPWIPKAVKDLAQGPGAINEVPTVMVFCESSSKEEQTALADALTPLAQNYRDEAKAAGDEDPALGFMVSTSAEGLAEKVRSMINLPAPSTKEKPRMALLDMPHNGSYYVADEDTDVNLEAVMKFIADYKGDTLTGHAKLPTRVFPK